MLESDRFRVRAIFAIGFLNRRTAMHIQARIRGKENSCDQLSGLLAAIVTVAFSVLFCNPATAQTSKKADVGWPMYNGGYAGDRFSSLKQITKKNVANLV